jgi:hypothetical protein
MAERMPLSDDTRIMIAPRLAGKAGHKCVAVIGVTPECWAASGVKDRQRKAREVAVIIVGDKYHFVTLEEAKKFLD